MVLFPLRLSDPSITSSWTRLAVWIISEIIAIALCPGSKSLHRRQMADCSEWHEIKALSMTHIIIYRDLSQGVVRLCLNQCLTVHLWISCARTKWKKQHPISSNWGHRSCNIRLMSFYPALLLWMLRARAISTMIIGRIALPLPSK